MSFRINTDPNLFTISTYTETDSYGNARVVYNINPAPWVSTAQLRIDALDDLVRALVEENAEHERNRQLNPAVKDAWDRYVEVTNLSK